MHNNRVGAEGEQAVTEWLKKEGFAIRCINYQTRFGEVDIIAQKKELWVFVEVKTRTTITFALSEVITPSKQKKIIKTAYAYIHAHNIVNSVFRFDVALVELNKSITYIPNAFSERQ